MDELRVIAVELPNQASPDPIRSSSACIYKNNKVYLYSRYGEMFYESNYKSAIGTIGYMVKEGRYKWSDFLINKGDIVITDLNSDIYLGCSKVEPISTLVNHGGSISDALLKLFNQFLRATNKDNPEICDSLKMSLQDGFFRHEIEQIIRNDSVHVLAPYESELIVRIRIEGASYIKDYVKEMLSSNIPSKLVDINFFFRRVFVLEKHRYVNFENTFVED